MVFCSCFLFVCFSNGDNKKNQYCVWFSCRVTCNPYELIFLMNMVNMCVYSLLILSLLFFLALFFLKRIMWKYFYEKLLRVFSETLLSANHWMELWLSGLYILLITYLYLRTLVEWFLLVFKDTRSVVNLSISFSVIIVGGLKPVDVCITCQLLYDSRWLMNFVLICDGSHHCVMSLNFDLTMAITLLYLGVILACNADNIHCMILANISHWEEREHSGFPLIFVR